MIPRVGSMENEPPTLPEKKKKNPINSYLFLDKLKLLKLSHHQYKFKNFVNISNILH